MCQERRSLDCIEPEAEHHVTVVRSLERPHNHRPHKQERLARSGSAKQHDMLCIAGENGLGCFRFGVRLKVYVMVLRDDRHTALVFNFLLCAVVLAVPHSDKPKPRVDADALVGRVARARPQSGCNHRPYDVFQVVSRARTCWQTLRPFGRAQEVATELLGERSLEEIQKSQEAGG